MDELIKGQLGAAWAMMAVGALWGASLGLFFHRAEWLGGYESWRRRLLRLGHIACFGMGLLNLAYSVTVGELASFRPPSPGIVDAGRWLWLAALFTMPTVCALAAWKPSLGHFFVVPVGATFAALGLTLYLTFAA